MRIVHVPYGFFPDAAGGTEQYVASLARLQQQRGHDVIVAAPGPQAGEYQYNGLPVVRYALSQTIELSALWGAGDEQAAEEFGGLLDRWQPTVVHLHAYTAGVSLRVAQEVTRRSLPLVFTYHSPSVTCARGTLLRWGREACSGVLGREPCAPCTLASYGMPRPLAVASAGVAHALARVSALRSGRLGTAARIPELVEERRRSVLAFLAQPARILVPAQWTRDLLVNNGVGTERVLVVPHGLEQARSGHAASAVERNAGELRVGFFGRLDPAKGAHLLIEALERDTKLPVRLVLFGIQQEGAHVPYAKAVRRRAAQDPRIDLKLAVPRETALRAMRGFDVIAVPSLVLETGPLVVLEAFAAGVPVLGTRLGGIAELVRDGQNGLLLPPEPAAWLTALKELVRRPDRLDELRAGIKPPRSLEAVADQVTAVYQAVAA